MDHKCVRISYLIKIINLQADLANSLGPVVKEHCDQLELQLRRLRQLVSIKDAPTKGVGLAIPQKQRLLQRLESTPLLPSQQRKNGGGLEQLNFSPIDEPASVNIQRSARERQSLRSMTKASIATNGTLNYCTPRFARKLVDHQSKSNETIVSAPRFATEFSLDDLSRNLQQPTAPNSLAQSGTSSSSAAAAAIDSKLNAELEEILAQLDQMFPSQPYHNSVRLDPHSENASVIKATNQVAGVLAEFVDGFNE